jgi:sec-independent protein translocase protein TatA
MFEGALMPTHWLVLLVIVLIIFGAGKLPNVMGDLGRGVKEFKKGQREDEAKPAVPTTPVVSASAPPAAGPVAPPSAGAPPVGTVSAAASEANGVAHGPERSARA